LANHKYIVVAHAYSKKGMLLAVATNSYTKTHPLQKHFAVKVGHPEKQFLHAEIACILRCKDQPIHTLKVWRYNKQGELVCAKPCAVCHDVILTFGIKEVWYSDMSTMFRLDSIRIP